MYSKLTTLIFWLLQLVCFQSYAQLALNTVHYSTADGLSDNRITVITKDRDGFMWFGSWAGLSRFDGYHFKTFKSYPGDKSPLKSNRFDEIVEDGAGQFLWIGAYDRRIYRFDKRTGIFVSLAQLLADSSLAKTAVTRILAVNGNEVWLKSEDAGLLLIKNSSASRPQATWFAENAENQHKLSSNKIDFFHLDSRKNVWLASGKKIEMLQLQPNGTYRVKVADVVYGRATTNFSKAKKGIMVGTSEGSLLQYSPTLQIISRSQVSTKSISYIAQSRKSGLTYCTSSSGELILVDENNVAKTLFTTKDSSPLGYIYEDATGCLWIGSQRHGVIRFDPSTKRPDYFFPQKDYLISDGVKNFIGFEDRAGTVHINFEGQISYYNARSGKMELLKQRLPDVPRPKNVVRYYYDPSGVLWSGSGYDGVDKMVFQENPFSYALPQPLNNERENNEVRGVFSNAKGTLLLGTRRGELFASQNGKGALLNIGKGFNKNAGIYWIMADHSGDIWLATKGNGLYRTQLDISGKEMKVASHYMADYDNRNAMGDNDI